MKTGMLDHIRRVGALKKSIVIARALAKDYHEITGSHCEALESEPGRRRKRDGSPSDKGVFLRTEIFKVSWYKFRSIEYAEQFRELGTQVIGHDNHKQLRQQVQVTTTDMGILETISYLEKEKSGFYHTTKAYESLAGMLTGLEYGV